jgi:ParB family transcriptional regulator, chromosome partitioning protein
MAARRKKAAKGGTGLLAREVAEGAPPAEIDALGEAVEAAGGAVLARYRDPLGGHWLLLASLPLDKVTATPFQREQSEAHVKRLVGVIPKVGRFLDPVIAIAAEDGVFWTPNGMHRLAAMKELGAKSLVALVVPEPKIAYRILALNTEKAHNLKDKSLEVVRMERALAAAPDTGRLPEIEWEFEFEEPAYPTIGLCYEERPRFSGAVYMPVLRRTEAFSDAPIREALKDRQARAARVLELDDRVVAKVEELKAAGLKSPYLKAFVVARVNPLRFVKAAKVGEAAPKASFDATVGKMLASVEKLDAARIRPQDVAVMGGGPAEE